jgi:hypothetical protein
MIEVPGRAVAQALDGDRELRVQDDLQVTGYGLSPLPSPPARISVELAAGSGGVVVTVVSCTSMPSTMNSGLTRSSMASKSPLSCNSHSGNWSWMAAARLLRATGCPLASIGIHQNNSGIFRPC